MVEQKLKKNITSNSAFWIGGKHAVYSAIANKKRKIHKLVLHEKYKNKEIIKDHHIKIFYENDNFFKKIFNNEIPHQGYALLVEKIKENCLKFYLENNKISNIVALDGITDPRNIGSIIRSAVAFDYDAILINKKDFNSKSFVMYKAASGAIENIIFIETSNIINEIKLLKSMNFWVVGMDGSAQISICDYEIASKNIIVFGSEGEGMRCILKKTCDTMCNIPINKKMESLNVSNAAAIALFMVKYKNKIST